MSKKRERETKTAIESLGVHGKYQILLFTKREDWRAWLAENHEKEKGVWVCSWRDEAKRVKYVDQVLEALCFGWIDSTCKSLDEQRLIQLFTPRRAKSTWSSLNKQRVAELEEKGLMTDAGRASIETAKANGHWSILESVEALEEPEELADALDATKHARKHWDAFPASEKKIQLLSIKTAQRQETREKRIAQIVEKAARNERPKKYAKKKD